MFNADKHVMSDNGKIGSLDFSEVKKASLIFRAVNHSLRQQILKLIEEMRKVTVTEMYVKLQLEQSVASQHLAILRRSSIVKTSRDGKFIFYELDYERLKDLTKCVKDLLGLQISDPQENDRL